MALMSWEQAIQHIRKDPAMKDLVRDAYLDKDNLAAANRFLKSEEYGETLRKLSKYLSPSEQWRVLDLGAGNGIASFAFASVGHRVSALEPDRSDDVGLEAIRRLSAATGVRIETITGSGESIPWKSDTFDLVYVRQVLHHANNLTTICGEAFRVLRPGGILMAAREHVISNDKQLQQFLDAHPLHHLCGGENAHRLRTYVTAIKDAGFFMLEMMGPYSSVINFYPQSPDTIRAAVVTRAGVVLRWKWIQKASENVIPVRLSLFLLNLFSNTPGRLYTFLAQKPS